MMLDWNLLQGILIIAVACSTVTVAFVQKTKKFCRNSRCITWYSLLVNIVFGILFSMTFTGLNYVKSLWVGLFSFLGADTIYRNLEGKLSSYTDLSSSKEPSSLEPGNSTPDNQEEIVGEIHYD